MIIKDVYGRVIYESKAGTIREVLEEAVKIKCLFAMQTLIDALLLKHILMERISFWLILVEHLSRALFKRSIFSKCLPCRSNP